MQSGSRYTCSSLRFTAGGNLRLLMHCCRSKAGRSRPREELKAAEGAPVVIARSSCDKSELLDIPASDGLRKRSLLLPSQILFHVVGQEGADPILLWQGLRVSSGATLASAMTQTQAVWRRISRRGVLQRGCCWEGIHTPFKNWKAAMRSPWGLLFSTMEGSVCWRRTRQRATQCRGCADGVVPIMSQGTCDKPSHSQISSKISYLIQSD